MNSIILPVTNDATEIRKMGLSIQAVIGERTDFLIAPARGDIIISTGANPEWTAYPISAPAANALTVLGLANGDLEPTWKTIFDMTVPSKIDVVASSAGTSLVASHVDHHHTLDLTISPTMTGNWIFNPPTGITEVQAGDLCVLGGRLLIGTLTHEVSVSPPIADVTGDVLWVQGSENHGIKAKVVNLMSDTGAFSEIQVGREDYCLVFNAFSIGYTTPTGTHDSWIPGSALISYTSGVSLNMLLTSGAPFNIWTSASGTGETKRFAFATTGSLTFDLTGQYIAQNIKKTQATNDSGLYIVMNGGASGATARGYFGYGHHGAASDFIFTGEVADSIGIRAEGVLHLGSGGNHIVMTLSTTGKVGIGMAPTYTLDVTGDVRCSTGFGCNGKTPQTAYASGVALAGYVTGAFGLDSDAHMSAMHALVVKIRDALVSNGIMS